VVPFLWNRFETMRREVELFIMRQSSDGQLKFIKRVLHSVPDNVLIVGESDLTKEKHAPRALPSIVQEHPYISEGSISGSPMSEYSKKNSVDSFAVHIDKLQEQFQPK
jgi:hypothetical protein